MAQVPEQQSRTVADIYSAYEQQFKPTHTRRLPAGYLGRKCARSIWYDFRWSGSALHTGQALRAAQLLPLNEGRLAADLKRIGCEVHTADESGNFFEYVLAGGHFSVRMDGAVLGVPEAPKTWHAVKFATVDSELFGRAKAKGLREAIPSHYVQLVLGMHQGELTRGLYLACDRTTDELYTERIKHDADEAKSLIEWAERIINAQEAPERIGTDRNASPCDTCHHSKRCHGTIGPDPAVPVQVNCRTCAHSTPMIDGLGTWQCDHHEKAISLADQEAGCGDHLFIPDFITFAKLADGGTDDGGWIEYQKPNGGFWRNANSGTHYRSVELTQIPSELVGAGTIDALKKVLGGEVIAYEGQGMQPEDNGPADVEPEPRTECWCIAYESEPGRMGAIESTHATRNEALKVKPVKPQLFVWHRRADGVDIKVNSWFGKVWVAA